MTVTPRDERRAVDSVPHGLFVGGAWRDAENGGTLPVEDPSTGAVLCSVADATAGDAEAALDAAHAAQVGWAATAPRVRGEILRACFERITEREDDLALLMTLEMGKPLRDSRAEVRYAAEFFRWFSEEAVRATGDYYRAPAGDGRIIVTRQPVGPCLLITPWNFPLAMGARKVAPAIAAGCTMVLKPAQLTPLCALALAEVLRECGLPDGVLNVITTSDPGVVTPLLADPRMRKLSFTGSTEVGRRLLELSAAQVLRTSMELGGNAPFLVFDDADVEAATDGAMLAKMRNMGEACTAANRFYVAEPVADEFVDRLVAGMDALTIGRGTEDGVDVGPLITGRARAEVAAMVDDAVERGAKIATQRGPVDGPGHFYPPTVLVDVPPDARVLQEEIFGPVAPVVRTGGDDEMIAAANATSYGLVAYAYTTSLQRGIEVGEALEAGMVGLNRGLVSNPAAPFGGTKQSGLGREGGHEGLDEFLEIKYIAVPGD
jgi:succinate-semialdehyde dehydrogenase/glutarate-semialdehyde dehydrogenase